MTPQDQTQTWLRPQPDADPAPAVDDVAGPPADDVAGPPADDVARSSSGYRVQLQVFEGPFDLLLQLVARRKLDVSEIDLAEITGEFLAHLHLDDLDRAVDLDTATYFLVVAATLVELKAARLLPGEEEFEQLIAEARDLLYARLLEFRAFRQAARMLQGLLETNAGYLPREAPLEPPFQHLVPEVALCTDPPGLAAIAASLLAPRPSARVDVGHIQRAAMSLHEAARRVLARLFERGQPATFRSLVVGLSRAERVVHFLALLELYKHGHVDLHQPLVFGPLVLERRTGGSDLAVLDSINSDAAGRREPDSVNSDAAGRREPDSVNSDAAGRRELLLTVADGTPVI